MIVTEILGLRKGDCSFSGKKAVDCFIMRVNGADEQLVAVTKTIEVLKWTASIGSNGVDTLPETTDSDHRSAGTATATRSDQ